MILTDKLIGLMAEKHFSQKDMACKLNMAPKTFSTKLKKGVFGSDEIETMIKVLGITNPIEIFFAKEVTL